MLFRHFIKLAFSLILISTNTMAFDRDALLVHYPFAGDAKDYSGNGYHGLVVGATLTSDREGNPNSAYFFNGNDIIRSSRFSGFEFGDQFTVSAWYKRTGLFDKYMGIINNGYFEKGSFEVRMGRENNGTNIFGRINSEGGITNALGFGDQTPQNNEWHHTVLTYDGSTTRFYIDGQLVESSSAASGDMLVKYNIVAIGMGGNAGGRGVTGEYFYGAIDDVRIYQKAFTASDVLSLFAEQAETGFILDAGNNFTAMAGENIVLDASQSYDSDGNPISFNWRLVRSPNDVPVTITDSLTANPSFALTQHGFYSFEVSGHNGEIELTDTVEIHVIPSVDTSELIAYYPIAGNANDFSGNGHHGVVSGAALTTGKDGDPNSAYFFDGRDRITINSLRNYGFGKSFSVSTWFRRTGQIDRYQGIINNGYNTFGSFEIRMGRESNGRVIFSRIRTNAGTTNGLGFNDVFPQVGQWNHAVLTYDGTVTRFYVNGEFVEQSYAATGDMLVKSAPVTIGHAGTGASNTEFFYGAIDDIRIYSKALTEDEVVNLYSGDTASNDTDGDGVEDGLDNCPLLNNSDQNDLDGDGNGDVCDEDVDGDSVDNSSDNCPLIVNQDQSDIDGDSTGDACDIDIDGDQINNTVDNCPLIQNSDQSDLDLDGLGDLCDSDIDGDSIDNDLDNCPTLYNSDQLDFDNDSVGDVCDDDIDNDSWINTLDCAPYNAAINPGAPEIINNNIDENCNPDDNTAEQVVENLMDIINNIDPSQFQGKNWAKTFENKLIQIEELVDSALASASTESRNALLQEALDKLDNDIIAKTNGCALAGAPDNNDKILNCTDQVPVYEMMMAFRDNIALLIQN